MQQLILSVLRMQAVQMLGEVPLWRWLYFIAWCLPLFSATRFCIFLCFMMLETRFFTSKRFLYYLIGIKVPV